MNIAEIEAEVSRLKQERGILLLAHSYQPIEIQRMADHVGDSLELSNIARDSQYDMIMFAAVYFMAETASMLSPEKKIMIAEKDAGCPLADTINIEQLRDIKSKHPGVPVVCYINSTAETKSEVDAICTSANALAVCRNIPGDELIFVPDQGLGSWIADQIDKNVILWDQGSCPTHWNVNPDEVLRVKNEHPDALLVCHPETHPTIREFSDHICGTSGMIDYVKDNPGKAFIIGTEIGMTQRLRHMFPKVTFYEASSSFICPDMKKTTSEKLIDALGKEETVVKVDKEIANKSINAIKRMYELTD